MGVNEDDVMNIMGGMEHAGGIKLNDHKRKLKNRFEISRKLGQGTYGKVQLGINKETGQQVAIKTIKKSKIETEADLIRIRREIQIMSSVQHPNIIHIYEVFENKEKMVLVMEIAAGGELYDYLSERKCLEENEARRVFRQISTAVYYCHKNNICHRDLKLENILLDENGNAKIADFGLSNVYDGKNLLNTFCGSPLYASPEIVRGSPYAGPEVDCWSLGVLLYTLVYGAMPFDGSNFKRLVKQITTGDYYEPKHPSSASSLIRTMLTVSSEKRANIGDICSHWWVNDGYGQTCLEEAEYLASLNPVRLDLLLSLAPSSKEEGDQVRATPSIPPEEAMSIVELPSNEPSSTTNDNTKAVSAVVVEPAEDVNKKQDLKNKRKLTETPSMVDPDLVSKKPVSCTANSDVVPMEIGEGTPTPAPAPKVTTSRSGRSTPKVHKKRKEGSQTPVNDLVPDMTPEIQRKPPKPKHSEAMVEQPQTMEQPSSSNQQHSSSSQQSKIKKRISRKERARDVKTPDPSFGPSSSSPLPEELEQQQEQHPRPRSRPSTPRQARAPSPEERPLVVPLPPPRMQDPSPVRKAQQQHQQQDMVVVPPALPPRPSSTPPRSQPPQDVVVDPKQPPPHQVVVQQQQAPPPPPPRHQSAMDKESFAQAVSHQPMSELTKDVINDIKKPPTNTNDNTTTSTTNDKLKQRMIDEEEEKRFAKQMESTIPAEMVEVVNLNQPELYEVEPLIMKDYLPPSLVHAKEAANSGIQSSSVAVEMFHPETAVMPEKKQQPTVPNPSTATSIISKAFEPPQTNTQTIPPESSLKKQSKNIVSSLTRQEQEEDMMMEEKLKKNQKIAEQEQPNTELNKSNIKPSSNVMKIVNSAQHSVASTESSTSKPNNKLHEASSEAVVIAKSEVLQQPVQKQNSKTVGNVPANSSEAMIPSSSITAATSRSSKRNEEIPQGSSSISSTSDSSSGKVVEAAAVGALLMQQPQDLKSVPIADTTTATNAAYVETTTSMTQATNTASVERLKDNNNECNNANVGMTKNDNNDADARCLINSMPKPFKSNIPEENSTELETQRQIEVLANAALLEQEAAEENINNDNIVATKSTPINTTTTSTSSDPNNPPPSTSTPNSNSSHSPSPSAMVSRQNSSQNSSPQNQSPQPMYHLLHRPEKRDNRDSKVFKAAAYWNNHVSEVMEKKKLPDNVKSLEKPKKITSAGVGPRGYENLKSAFEQNRLNNNNSNGTNLANPDDVNNNNNGNNIVSANGGIMQRRNSRKIAPVEGCTPGLKVTDAKSVFEMKSQQSPTPVLYRRNSSMSSGDNSKINSSITKGKESADEVIGGQDQQPTTTRTTSNGPNYIKKKVPEFPPQPQQPLATTKTPFGNAALRRHGALSPRTVLNTTTSSDLETTATNKLPTTPEAIVTKAPPKFNKPQQQAQAPQSIDSSTVDNTNSSDLLSSSTSKPSATQKIKISVQENHPTLAMNEVNGHIEKDMATPKLKNVEKASNTIAAPKTPIEENSANSSKPEQSNSKLDQIVKKPDKASSGPVLTIKGISKEEGVLATMTSIPSSSDEQQKKNNNISRKEVLKEPLNKVDNFANQQKPLQPADSKNTNDNTTEAQQPAINRNLISHQKISKHEPVKNELMVPTATKAEKTSNLEIPKQKITDKPLVPDKSPVLSKKKDKAVISNKENLDKTTFASPVPTTSTTTTTSSKVVSDPIPKDNIEIPKSSIANIKSSKDTIIPANETISGTPAFRSIKIDKEEPSMSVTSPSTQKTSSKSTTADNTILTTPETLEIPVERAKDNINKPAPLRIIPIQIEQTNNNLSSGVASNLEQPSITNEDIRISSPNPVSNNRQEHHIPIHVEGKGTIINNNNNLLDSSAAEMAAADLAETRDSFSTNSLSRRRFGSRKKRISSAYSDSSMTSAEDEAQAAAAASENPGLQKYTSIGKQTKHGEPMFRLRKTRPPFAAQRSDSFSSDEDDFDDDGFREMTAENLFSTLLTRVKSLTRRIHDDHDLEGPGSSQIMRGSGGGTGGGSSSSSGFQQNHGIINHRLNPGNTHARLERSALRNSLKRSTNNNTPTAGLSRQSSMDASLRTSLRDSDIMSAAATSLAGFEDGSSMRSFGSHGGTGAGGDLTRGGSSNQQRGITTSTTNDDIISSKLDSTNQYSSGGANIQGKEEQSMSKRYIDLDLLNIHGNSSSGKTEQPSAASTTENCTNVSVTSKQRLRPGYLPPPSHLASDQTDSTSHDTRIEHALSESSSLKNLISSSTTTTGTTARHIPINVEIQQQQSDRNITLGSSNLSSTSLASGPSMTDMLESISEKNNSVASNSGNRQSKEDLQQNSNNRRQSYLQDEESMFKSLKTMGSGGNSSSSKSVPLKRLSGNFDSLQENNNPENENSSSSGYYSNQHQQLKHHPRNPTSKKTMEGPRASTSQSMKNYSSNGNNALRKGTAMDHYRKISSEMQMAESDMINRLRREAAERANDLASEMSDGFVSPIDPEFFSADDSSVGGGLAGIQRKRSQNLSRVDEFSNPTGRPPTLSQRSLSRESYGGDTADGSDILDKSSWRNPGSTSRHVTRRSISRELYDYNPTWAPSQASPISPGSSRISENNGGGGGSTALADFSRSSRERSLGRDSTTINFEPSSALNDLEKRISNRRSESLSRPSLASQGRSLTQSELGSSSSRRYSSGLRSPLTVQTEDDSSGGLYKSRMNPDSSSSLLSYSVQPSRYATLDDKSRSDWRRVSVPERGKDFKSLSKKYNRYSNIIEDKPGSSSYLATTSVSSRVDPEFLSSTSRAMRSNSQNRILSPTFNSSASLKDFSSRRKPTESGANNTTSSSSTYGSSGSGGSLRLDNYLTLQRHHHRRTPIHSNYISPSPSPMVLSPSATRNFNIPSSPSREGSVTPKFSHSCSNASIVSEATTAE